MKNKDAKEHIEKVIDRAGWDAANLGDGWDFGDVSHELLNSAEKQGELGDKSPSEWAGKAINDAVDNVIKDARKMDNFDKIKKAENARHYLLRQAENKND